MIHANINWKLIHCIISFKYFRTLKYNEIEIEHQKWKALAQKLEEEKSLNTVPQDYEELKKKLEEEKGLSDDLRTKLEQTISDFNKKDEANLKAINDLTKELENEKKINNEINEKLENEKQRTSETKEKLDNEIQKNTELNNEYEENKRLLDELKNKLLNEEKQHESERLQLAEAYIQIKTLKEGNLQNQIELNKGKQLDESTNLQVNIKVDAAPEDSEDNLKKITNELSELKIGFEKLSIESNNKEQLLTRRISELE